MLPHALRPLAHPLLTIVVAGLASEDRLIQPCTPADEPGGYVLSPVERPPLTSIVAARAIWRRPWLVAAFIALALAAGVIYLHMATYRYTVALRVAPTATDNGSLLSKFGGLAAAAGINVPTSKGVSPFDLYVESITGRNTADALARDTPLMHTMFGDQWDAVGRRWHEPTSTGYQAVRWLKGVAGIPVTPWHRPGGGEVADYLERKVTLIRDAKKSIATIQIVHADPRFASRLLAELHENIDSTLRRRSLARSREYISYLTTKLSQVQLNEHREALAQALGEEERNLMMSSARSAYAAEPFGPVNVSLKPTEPKPALVLGFALILGCLVGSCVAVIRELFHRQLYT